MVKMFNISTIVDGNRSSFYDYRTNSPRRTWPLQVLFLACAIICGFLINGDMQNLLNGVITVQSILIGFSFTVMFFLVSKDGDATSGVSGYIEDKLKEKRIKKLSRELFYNISYFNITAIFCVAAAVLLMVPAKSDFIWYCVHLVPKVFREWILGAYAYISMPFIALAKSFFFFFLFESSFSFVRTSGRVAHLFEEKLPPQMDGE